MSNSVSTVMGLLEQGAAEANALSAPGGVPLTYRTLRKLAADTLVALNARGIGRNDRIAIVLDNGPEMAAAFLCVATGATAAPLNPAYRAEEFEFYLTDLKAKLLIVGHQMSSPAVDVAKRLAIPLVRLVPVPYGEDGSGASAEALRGIPLAVVDGLVLKHRIGFIFIREIPGDGLLQPHGV